VRGAWVVAIERKLDVIRTPEWILDLGLEAA
jgi:excinuclease UvrABC ATPase subunit